MMTEEFNEALHNRERYVDTTCYEALRRIEAQERERRRNQRAAEMLKRNPHGTRAWHKRRKRR